jgi:uncharacterized protein YcaQ
VERFAPHRAALDELAYGRRTLFEYWAHAACLVPVEHFPRGDAPCSTIAREARLGALEEEAAPRGVASHREAASAARTSHRRPPRRAGWWNWKPTASTICG